MAFVDVNERELTLKLVYYGPPLSGKTTNLRQLHDRVDERGRGRLLTLETRDDRTLFFDLLPLFFEASGLSFRLKVYTVPGQPMHAATRRVVLQGADGIAFIADSDPAQAEANRESFASMLDNLQRVGLDPARVPIVVQYNKRDLPAVLEGEGLSNFDWGQRPVYLATALRGEGVLECFFGLVAHTWDAVNQHVPLERSFKMSRETFLDALQQHLDIHLPPGA